MKLSAFANSPGIMAFVWLGLAPAWLAAENPPDYAERIKPVLRARCYACHGALKQEAGLRLDTAAAIRKGGDSGPAIVPGNAAESLLIQKIAASETERMPPEGAPLSAAEIREFQQWIAAGANAPADEQPEADPDAHWAFLPPVAGVVPPMPANGRNAIDAFLAQALQKQGLTAAPPASRETLLRRVYLDLIGLPPTPQELKAFLADESPTAYEQAVDRLLDDPRYGERWGRHWMDVWRYSDWHGRRQVPDVWNSAPQIWRWRDWIVRSLNEDKGYDRMLSEMLAADEINPENPDSAVATGFLIRNWYALNPNDWMRNTVEHTGKAFLGLTFNCAHCHDHKYDPISHEDYFRLRAFFEPIYIRQDRVAGQADPGPYQDYDYSTLRKIQRLGLVRVFDKTPDAPTWFYTGGDERNRVTERGSISPGVPALFAEWRPKIEPIRLPPRAWYPGLQPGIQETVRTEARDAATRAEAELAALKNMPTTVPEAAREQLAKLEAEFRQATEKSTLPPLSGQQSLLIDAVASRRTIHHRLPGLMELPEGLTLRFQLKLLADPHFNFQLIKHLQQGLTAGFVGFEQGRIMSYRPGGFSEFDVARYDVAGPRHFQITLTIQPQSDRCLLSIQSLPDGQTLAEAVPVALNGWNPITQPEQGILFDARPGSRAAVDDLIISAPAATAGESARIAAFDFEAPGFAAGRDVVGQNQWERTGLSGTGSSLVSVSLGDQQLSELQRQLDAARRAVRFPELRFQAAEARLHAAREGLVAVEARIAADRAKYGETPGADVAALARAARQHERQAALLTVQAEILATETALATAEAKPTTDANREKEIAAARQQGDAALGKLAAAETAMQDQTSTAYTPFSPIHPETSTGRRKALAEWIVHRRNPLAARVAVNHIWLRHFHSPLVSSVYDFGRNGALPTHPELLDWLAVQFMDSGWSMKELHRLIVVSAAYRRGSGVGELRRNLAVDPENKLLWRMNAGRMEAEVLRDSLLYLAGQLDPRLGGQELENSEALTTNRRSLYYAVHPEQGGQNALGELFDAPTGQECYRRTRSIVPQQALALTNSDLVHRLCGPIASREAPPEQTDDEFIAAMFQRILSRSPTTAELDVCRQALQRQRTLSATPAQARESLARALLNHNDFLTIR